MTDNEERNVFSYICNIKVATWIFLVLNSLLLLAGSFALCCAIWVGWDRHALVKLTGLIDDEEIRIKVAEKIELFVVDRVIYVIIGFLAALVSANSLGCSAVLPRERRCLLNYYFTFLFVILVLEFTAGCLATGYAFKGERQIKAAMNASLYRYNMTAKEEEKTTETLIWDSIFTKHECCGVYDYNDFEQISTASNITGSKVPGTCCPSSAVLENGVSKCPIYTKGTKILFQVGCYDAIFDVIVKKIIIVRGIIIGLVLSQFISIILVWFLDESILKRNLKSTQKIRWLLTEPFGL
ncbi:hypothetical protein B7P43_G05112 [Cryptotermes secundus]|uniref:Tetraspanin n=2 Tax=Cryptotermes secundus TaxID=105785 RepID=A0A2J7PXS4_9NEOP|nr:hypothetical protein B7P43_G05112 [Cryptotermes secundus]